MQFGVRVLFQGGLRWCTPVETVEIAAQTLKENRRLNGRGREKSTVAVVVIIIMLEKIVKR